MMVGTVRSYLTKKGEEVVNGIGLIAVSRNSKIAPGQWEDQRKPDGP